MARTRVALHIDIRADGWTYTEGRTIYVSRRERHKIKCLGKFFDESLKYTTYVKNTKGQVER